MRKIIVFIFTLVSFVACDLNNVEPVQTGAFMKFFGDLGNTRAADIQKLNDGYLLLGNNSVNNTVFLIHVDKKGNTLAGPWTEQNFIGQSVTTDGASYFIVGDRIDTTNPDVTDLGVLKVNTSLESAFTEVNLGAEGVPYHGTAITIDSRGEIVVCGYTYGDGRENQSFIRGFDANLVSTWDTTQFQPVTLTGTNPPVVSGKNLYESTTDNYVWTTLANTGSSFQLTRYGNPRDVPSTSDGLPLLTNYNVGANLGEFSPTINGAVLVQNILTPSNEIALSTYTTNPDNPVTSTIAINGFSLVPNAVIQDPKFNEYVILATTTRNRDNDPTRSDTDFYITRVGADGVVSEATGFTTIFGGTGNEEGVAIVQADDGGYVILGTMRNTNDRDLMVLLKINSNGELIN